MKGILHGKMFNSLFLQDLFLSLLVLGIAWYQNSLLTGLISTICAQLIPIGVFVVLFSLFASHKDTSHSSTQNPLIQRAISVGYSLILLSAVFLHIVPIAALLYTIEGTGTIPFDENAQGEVLIIFLRDHAALILSFSILFSITQLRLWFTRKIGTPAKISYCWDNSAPHNPFYVCCNNNICNYRDHNKRFSSYLFANCRTRRSSILC